MTKEKLLSLPLDEAKAWIEKVAIYASEWCTGATDQPRFIAPKVQKAMFEALKNEEDPVAAMNKFLGTNFNYEDF